MRIYFGYQVDALLKEKDHLIDELKRHNERLEKEISEKNKKIDLAVDGLLNNSGQRPITVPEKKVREKDDLASSIIASLNSIGGDTKEKEPPIKRTTWPTELK